MHVQPRWDTKHALRPNNVQTEAQAHLLPAQPLPEWTQALGSTPAVAEAGARPCQLQRCAASLHAERWRPPQAGKLECIRCVAVTCDCMCALACKVCSIS